MTFTVDESKLTPKEPERAPLAVRLILGPIVACAVAALFTMVSGLLIGLFAVYLFPVFLIVCLCGCIFGKPKPKKTKKTKWVKVQVEE